MGHEVITGHHGDLEVETSLLNDFLYGVSTGQRVHASRVTDHTNTCGTTPASTPVTLTSPWKRANWQLIGPDETDGMIRSSLTFPVDVVDERSESDVDKVRSVTQVLREGQDHHHHHHQ